MIDMIATGGFHSQWIRCNYQHHDGPGPIFWNDAPNHHSEPIKTISINRAPLETN